jgi:hypothetical protein
VRKPNESPQQNPLDADDRPDEFDADAAEQRGEPVGASRQVKRGGPDQADPDGETTDGEYGPGSD